MKNKSRQLTDLTLYLDSISSYATAPKLEKEYQFHKPRKWRFDFAFPEKKVAVEYEGGVFRTGGGFHQSIHIMEKNMYKYNQAAIDGWKVLRFCAPMVRAGEAFNQIEMALYPIEIEVVK